jgi:hypothetical protein
VGSRRKTGLYHDFTLIKLLAAITIIALLLGNTTVIAGCDNPPVGDLNGDCKVDLADFVILADHYMEDAGSICMCFPIGDINEDCIVNFLDLATIVNTWLDDTST